MPEELVEAARIDGAGRWRVFWDITFPLLLPIFVILTSLSIIWDFQVFNQVWLVRDGEPEEDYWLMSVYSFVEAFRLGEYGFGAAIAVVMVGFMFLATFVYLRQMIRIGETTMMSPSGRAALPVRPSAMTGRTERPRRGRTCAVEQDRSTRWACWLRHGLPRLLDGLDGVQGGPQHPLRHAAVLPAAATLSNFEDVIDRLLLLGRRQEQPDHRQRRSSVPLVVGFLAALALAKFRFHGRAVFIVLILGVQMVPLNALIIPLYIQLSKAGLTNERGVIITYLTFVLPFTVWTCAACSGSRELEEAAMVDGSTRFGAFVRILLPLVAPGLGDLDLRVRRRLERVPDRVRLLNDAQKQPPSSGSALRPSAAPSGD